MNLETTPTHTLTLNDRERDLLATIINRAANRHIDSFKTEEDVFADRLFDHLEAAGARIILGPDEAMPASLARK